MGLVNQAVRRDKENTMLFRYCASRSIIYLTAVIVGLLSGCASTTMTSSKEELQSVGDKEGVVVGSVLITAAKVDKNESVWSFLKGRKADDLKYAINIADSGYENPFKERYKIMATAGEETVFIKKLPAGNYDMDSLGVVGWDGSQRLTFLLSINFDVKPQQTTYIGRLMVNLPERITKGSPVKVSILDAQQETIEKLKNEYPSIASDTVTDLATTQKPIPLNAALMKYPQLPRILDGKGLFVVSKSQASQLKIKSVKVSDWLVKDDGKLVDRNRVGNFEYDVSGNILEFSGQKDQSGNIKIEYIYTDNNLSEKILSIKTEEGFKYVAKESFEYVNGRQTVGTIFDNTDKIKIRKKYMYDSSGNNNEIHHYDTNGKIIEKITKMFDEYGNVIEKIMGNVKETYSYDKHKITVFRLTQNNDLLGSIEYIFNKEWYLLSYFRKSGYRKSAGRYVDGFFGLLEKFTYKYWDKFTYAYNADALPIEKVWSRKEMLIQDPYQLTKYSYQYEVH